MTVTDTQDAQLSALIGRTWRDEKGRRCEVQRFSNDPGKLRCVRRREHDFAITSSFELTHDEVRAALGEAANRELQGESSPTSEAAEATPGSDLIGKSWTDEDGATLTADRIEDGDVVAKYKDGFEQYYSLDEVRELLAEEADEDAPEQTEESTPEVVDDETVDDHVEESDPESPPAETPNTVDPELAAAGYADDQRYRNEQLDSSQDHKAYDLPNAVIKVFTQEVRKLIALLQENGGNGDVTLKAKAKCGEDSREIFFEYQITPKPPKLKADGYLWVGDELVPGVKKKADDKQTTITDAIKQAGEIPPAKATPAPAAPESTPHAEDPTDPLTLTTENARAVLVYPGDHAEPFRAAAVAMAKADPTLIDGIDIDPLMLQRINAQEDPGEQVGDDYITDDHVEEASSDDGGKSEAAAETTEHGDSPDATAGGDDDESEVVA